VLFLAGLLIFEGSRAGRQAAMCWVLPPCPAERRIIRRIDAQEDIDRMREADERLIGLLKANAREPAASLARKLGVARSTVQERIARLEREGVVKGYTVRLGDQIAASRIRAIVMIATDVKRGDRTTIELKKHTEVRSLYAVSGTFDLVATVEADTPARMDAVLDRIGRTHGVARTVTSIVLSEKFSR
jgi:DNA-binding Lrp family transcriptional regulator